MSEIDSLFALGGDMDGIDADLSILDALCAMDGTDMAAAAAAEIGQDDDEHDDEDEDSYDADGQPRKKRVRRTRTELNEIEKQRTRRINEQIQSLRALLEASGLNTKKDKFSILKNTTEYLKKLKLLLNKSQSQLQALAQTHRKAQAAAAAAAAAVAAVAAPAAAVQKQAPKAEEAAPPKQEATPGYYVDVDPDSAATRGPCGHTMPGGDAAMQMMIQRPPIAPGTVVESGAWNPNKKSADYALMFQNASIAMAVASLDGKFVDCNGAFSIISGYSNDEVLKRSVFDLTPAEDCQELMSIVGKMMESPEESAKHFWKRCCFENRDCHCFVSMWLVRKTSGDPVYFQCAVLPLEDYPMSNRSVTYDASALPASSTTNTDTPVLEAGAAATGVNTLLEQGQGEEGKDKIPVPVAAAAATEEAAAAAATE